MTIAIVDLEVGNCGSIASILTKLNISSIITSNPNELLKAEKIILPGVGAFDTVMSTIERFGLREVLIQQAVEEKKPLLGICVGMQVLTEGSEEGKLPGLGIIPGYCKKFKTTHVKVPHMGWNQLHITNPCVLFNDLSDDARFYFVHSYYVVPKLEAHITSTTTYDISFASAIQTQTIFGVQFHPEKSHRYGAALIKNFVEL